MTGKTKEKDPFLELLSVAQEGSIYARQQAIKDWWNKWVEEVEGRQHVLNNKFLGLEHRDIIRERLALTCLEQCMDNVAVFKENDKAINIKFKAIRRRPR